MEKAKKNEIECNRCEHCVVPTTPYPISNHVCKRLSKYIDDPEVLIPDCKFAIPKSFPRIMVLQIAIGVEKLGDTINQLLSNGKVIETMDLIKNEFTKHNADLEVAFNKVYDMKDGKNLVRNSVNYARIFKAINDGRIKLG